MRSLFFILLSLLILNACGESKPPLQLPQNAAQLLAGDSSKIWMLAQRYNGGVRVSMGPCYMGFRQIFRTDGTFSDNNGEQEASCGETMRGSWSLRHDKANNPYLTLKSSLIPKALGIDKDFKDFQIIEISDKKLVLRFKHALFTNKTTVIEDTYVPADEELNDRYFHW